MLLDVKTNAALIELTIESKTKQVSNIKWQGLELKRLAEDPIIKEQVEDYDERLRAMLSEPVITLPEDLSSRRELIQYARKRGLLRDH